MREILLFFFILVSQYSFAQTYSSATEKKIKLVENSLAASIQLEGDTLMNLHQRLAFYKLPGVSVAVIKDYKLDWARAYGYADKKAGTKATTETLYQAASISKSLNGVGALLLVQQKKIDLNADINQYLTSWQFPYDSLSRSKKISLGNLLSHTAGLSVHGFPGYEVTAAFPTVIQILNGDTPANTKAVRSMFEPGSKVQYSGGGTTLCQLIITDVSKEKYADFMQEKVLKPMGMTSSFYHQPPPTDKQQHLATGYDGAGNEIKGKYHIYPEQAAAGLWTNPGDLAKYIIETQLAYAGKSEKVLNQQTTRLRLTPFIGEEAALGVFIMKKGKDRYFSHGGANEGYRCVYIGDVEKGNGVVVMVNSDNGNILNEIVNSVATVYDWKDYYKPNIKKQVRLADSVLSKYQGTYELSPDFKLEVKMQNGQLMVEATGQSKVKLYAENDTTFFVMEVDAKLEFIKDKNGVVEKVILHQGGQKMEGKKIKNP